MVRPVSLPDLRSKRLIVVLGKGGVGRTTVAAALALVLARQGRRTLLFQANAKEKLSQYLGGPPVGEQIVKLRENLWAVNTTPTASLHEYGLMVLRYETLYKMVFENRLTKSLVRAIPGVDDYSMLGKLWYHTTDDGNQGWDTIIFDAPATGHAVQMLRVPQAIMKAVPQGPLTRDAVKVRAILEDPAITAPLLVTLPEEMPTNETIELAARLTGELNMHPVGLVANQVWPDRFRSGSVGSRVLDESQDEQLGPLIARGKMERSRRELNERYLARLADELPLPTAHVPMIFSATMGLEETQAVSRVLEQAMFPDELAAARPA
jgi:anion-transporting  ArsA/GET3 family ATPase